MKIKKCPNCGASIEHNLKQEKYILVDLRKEIFGGIRYVKN